MEQPSWARIKPKAHGEGDSGAELSKNVKVQKCCIGLKAPCYQASPLAGPGRVARPGSESDSPATPGAPSGAKTVLKRTFGPVWKRGVRPSSDRRESHTELPWVGIKYRLHRRARLVVELWKSWRGEGPQERVGRPGGALAGGESSTSTLRWISGSTRPPGNDRLVFRKCLPGKVAAFLGNESSSNEPPLGQIRRKD